MRCAWNAWASVFASDLGCSCRVGCWLLTDVSGHSVVLVFHGQAVQSEESEELQILYAAAPLSSCSCEGYSDIFFKNIFLFSRPSTPTLVPTEPHVLWVLGGEVNHPLPSTAEVKNEWSYTSTPCMPSYDSTFALFACTKLTDVDAQPSGIKSRGGRDFPHPSRPALGPTQPPIQCVASLSRGVKRPGYGVDHPPLSSTEVKERAELFLHLWAFMACSSTVVTFTFTPWR